MPEDVKLKELYSRLEKIHGDSLEEKSAKAYRKSTQERMDIEITTDSENNPLRVKLSFGPHHFIEIGLIDSKVHVLKGETHHSTMYEAASVPSEWESVIPGRDGNSRTEYFDDLPSGHQKINFHRAVDELAQYYLRPTEE
jgi:hypothetical protein